jgi:hypothetical protein
MNSSSRRHHLRVIYRVPNEMISDEQYDRRHHVDLARMGDRELLLEEHRLKCMLACYEPSEADRAWLWERLTRVIAERPARLAKTRPDPRKRSK